MDAARRVWDVLEPIAANVYFAPEVHGALEALGFGGGTPGGPNGIHYPDGPAYFASRGAALGAGVAGEVVAAAFGVFKREMVVAVVDVARPVAAHAHRILHIRDGKIARDERVR